MATGAPDWQGLRWKVESVVRPNLTYPSGKIIVYDDFESPLSKWIGSGATAYEVSLNTSKAFRGTASLELTTGTGAGFFADASRYFGLPSTSKVGFQFVWHMPGADAEYMTQSLDFYDGTTLHQASVRYDFANTKWQYRDTASVWQDISGATQDLAIAGNPWHFTKVTVDFAEDTFLRLYSNASSWDLSSISLRTTASSNSEEMAVAIRFDALGSSQRKLYIDEVAITEE